MDQLAENTSVLEAKVFELEADNLHAIPRNHRLSQAIEEMVDAKLKLSVGDLVSSQDLDHRVDVKLGSFLTGPVTKIIEAALRAAVEEMGNKVDGLEQQFSKTDSAR